MLLCFIWNTKNELNALNHVDFSSLGERSRLYLRSLAHRGDRLIFMGWGGEEDYFGSGFILLCAPEPGFFFCVVRS